MPGSMILGVSYTICTMRREMSGRQVKSSTRSQSFLLIEQDITWLCIIASGIMITIKVTDSHTFLRQGQQLRGEYVRGVRLTFNTVTESSSSRIVILVTIMPPAGNTNRKRMVLRQHTECNSWRTVI